MRGYRNSDIGLTATPTRTDLQSERSLTATRCLQRLERAIAVQGAAPFEPDIRPLAAETFVVLVFVKPRDLLGRFPHRD
jgi:hypothetical protein